MNKYTYVSNNPVSKADPLGLYELDVHYYLTYYIVSNHPCFSDADAKEIAEGDQGTDGNPHTMPGPGWKESWWDLIGVFDQDTPDYEQQLKNMDYHALHPGAHPGVGSPALWKGAMQGGGNLKGLGVYLHHLQDTFSHEGFHNPSYGHLYGTHRPDKPWSDGPKAMEMAQATWDALNEFARQRACPCEGGAVPDGMWPVMQQFAEAPTSGAGWVDARYPIDEAPSYTWGFLMQKIKILGVPSRSATSIWR